MKTLEDRLRAATRAAAASVADDSAPPLVLSPSKRHRLSAPGWQRWRRRLIPAAAAASVLAIIATSLAIAGGGGGHRTTGHAGTASFPSGRILFADSWGLRWLYPDGKTTYIAHGFIGASMVAGGTKLLAWRPTQNPHARPPCGGCFADVDYYLMNLNGSGRRLVLRAEPTSGKVQVGHLSVEASPDGRRLAYVRQGESRSTGNNLFDQLWAIDLANGHKIDLGRAPSSDTAFTWGNNSTLLAESANGTTLQEVSVTTGRKTTYLTVSNPRIVRAYERARPGAGSPKGIDPIGWSTDSTRSALAVTLWGGSRLFPTKAVIALVGRGVIRSYAPDSKPLLTLTWGPAGRFMIESALATTAVKAGLYAGMVGTSKLYRLPSFGRPDKLAFSPQGTVIAQGYESGTWAFVRAPAAMCHTSAGCASFRPMTRDEGERLIAWAP